MFRHLRLLPLIATLLLETTPTGEDDDDQTPEGDRKVTFTEDQQQAINALLAKERKSAEERTAERIKAEAAEARRKDEEQRERDAAEQRGDFEQVKTDLTEKLSAAEGERDTYKERLDAALTVIAADVAATWGDVPEEVRDLYDGDDDPLAKKTFLARPATVKLIERLTAKPSARGNDRDPNPDGNRDVEIPSVMPRSRLF